MAGWYLECGVAVVWLVLPDTREVVVLTPDEQQRYGAGTMLPEHSRLPGLAPAVSDLFTQLSD